MRYHCDKCNRTVELSPGSYTCQKCGSPMRPMSSGESSGHHSNSNSTGKIQPLYQSTRQMLISAIFKEIDAIDDYAEIINKLRAEGHNSEADIVEEIRNDEIDHKKKFEAILLRLYSWILEGFL